MKDNYYTPELEDVYVGYECEIRSDSNDTIWWEQQTIKKGWSGVDDTLELLTYYIKYNFIRTKYLDKDDIESLGFKYKETIRSGDYFTKDNLGLIYIKEDNILIMYKIYEDIKYNQMIFEGNCKSINELKKIIKYLGY